MEAEASIFRYTIVSNDSVPLLLLLNQEEYE